MSESLSKDPQCISRGGCMRPEECRRHGMCMRPAIPAPEQSSDDWTKIPVHCAECGVQFLRKVRHQRYCDNHRYLAGAVIRPQESVSSNERLMLREDGKPYSPDMELSWQTFLGNRGAMSPEFFEVARIAYIAAWHASLTYAKRRADETECWQPIETAPKNGTL